MGNGLLLKQLFYFEHKKVLCTKCYLCLYYTAWFITITQTHNTPVSRVTTWGSVSSSRTLQHVELTSGWELNYRFPSSEKSLYGGQVGIFSDFTMLDGMILKITLTVQQI